MKGSGEGGKDRARWWKDQVEGKDRARIGEGEGKDQVKNSGEATI